jgi:peptidyl-dipeptidase A
MKSILLAATAALALLSSNAVAQAPTAADATKFLADAEKQISAFSDYAQRVSWVNATYITDDTDWLSSKVGEEGSLLSLKLAKEAAVFDKLDLPKDVRRKLSMLKTGNVLVAPEAQAKELADITTRLSSAYGKGRGTSRGKEVAGNDLEDLMRTETDPAVLKEQWTSWHNNVGRPMKADYTRMVEIANAGARELGFKDTGALWRSNYDMEPDAFAAEVDRLWGQVKPLYDQLHCYMRGKLNAKYGDAIQAKTGPIRADLLGNMWAQEWGAKKNKDMALPAGTVESYDIGDLLAKAKYTPLKMVQTGEGFFSSLGFDKLPQSFWQRSQFTKPQDREVICHASAWDVDNVDDLRIKMCIKVNGTDFITIHHELGHNYYQRAYNKQDLLYKNGANDGFHEAIGDMLALSVTPDYLVKIGLLDKAPDAKADMDLLMGQALDKIAFLPFGLLVDKWRWQVFSGELKPEQYNAGWWALRTKYQGIVPPTARGPEDFDPGAKYHVPGNTPYARYFLARILQFQFHQAACKAAGWQGPLHRCSIYGNKEVGKRFNAMMAMGASKPWPDALEAFTGSRKMDGAAIIAYFQPVMTYLKKENAGQQCGW